MKKFKPLGDRILVRRSKAQQTKSGIFLPDSAKEKPKQGIVLAVGPGKRDQDGVLMPVSIPLNSTVIFGSYAGTELPSTEDEEFLILTEDDVLAIIE